MGMIKDKFQQAAKTVYESRGKTTFDKQNLTSFLNLLTPLSMLNVSDSIGPIACEFCQDCASRQHKFIFLYKNQLYSIDYRYLEITDVSQCGTPINPINYLTDYLDQINN